MSTIDDEIRAKTEAFANDLAVLVRRAALEAVAAALGGDTTVAAPVQAAVKRGRKKVAPVTPAATAPAVATPAKVTPASKPAISRGAAPKRAPGAKRPPRELAVLTEKLGEFIKANPGVRMEVIAKALGTPATALRFPARKLVTGKKVRTEGQKQNTVYFPV